VIALLPSLQPEDRMTPDHVTFIFDSPIGCGRARETDGCEPRARVAV